MMKMMCDCGCGHAITEYDAGQMPVILQHGELLMELRIVPGPTGARPNVRPTCARAAVVNGDIVFPRLDRADDAAGRIDLAVRSINGRRAEFSLGEGDGEAVGMLTAQGVTGR